MERPRHVFQVYIRTTPERLWQAITDPAFTKRYFFQTRVDTTLGARRASSSTGRTTAAWQSRARCSRSSRRDDW